MGALGKEVGTLATRWRRERRGRSLREGSESLESGRRAKGGREGGGQRRSRAKICRFRIDRRLRVDWLSRDASVDDEVPCRAAGASRVVSGLPAGVGGRVCVLLCGLTGLQHGRIRASPGGRRRLCRAAGRRPSGLPAASSAGLSPATRQWAGRVPGCGSGRLAPSGLTAISAARASREAAGSPLGIWSAASTRLFRPAPPPSPPARPRRVSQFPPRPPTKAHYALDATTYSPPSLLSPYAREHPEHKIVNKKKKWTSIAVPSGLFASLEPPLPSFLQLLCKISW